MCQVHQAQAFVYANVPAALGIERQKPFEVVVIRIHRARQHAERCIVCSVDFFQPERQRVLEEQSCPVWSELDCTPCRLKGSLQLRRPQKRKRTIEERNLSRGGNRYFAAVRVQRVAPNTELILRGVDSAQRDARETVRVGAVKFGFCAVKLSNSSTNAASSASRFE